MPAAMTLISSQTLGSAVSSVTFGSGGTLTQAYRDLRLVVTWTGSGASSDIYVQMNADTTAGNYSTVEANGDGSTTSSTSFSRAGLYLQYFNSAQNAVKVATLDILDYAQTDKHKTGLNRSNSADGQVTMRASRWASTAAVTSITVISASSQFAAGSTFMLYGIAG